MSLLEQHVETETGAWLAQIYVDTSGMTHKPTIQINKYEVF